MTIESCASSRRRAGRGDGLARASLCFALLALLLFGLAYALAATGLAGAIFPHGARGSLIERHGRIVGSALVAQPFAGPGYFYPRPSAAGYDALALAGSNRARSHPELADRLARMRARIAQREGIAPDHVPPDLVTQSGGGIDPHVSPAGARVQAARVARERGLDPARVTALVESHVEPPQFGMLGERRVNVLRLNLALDELATLK